MPGWIRKEVQRHMLNSDQNWPREQREGKKKEREGADLKGDSARVFPSCFSIFLVNL